MTGTAILQLGKTCAVCPDCEETITGVVFKDVSGNSICEKCFNASDLVVCEDCNEVFERDDCRENPYGVLWCYDCVDESCCTCEHCDEERWSDDISEVSTRNHWGASVSQYWCESCVNNNAFHCDDCGNTVCDDIRTDTAGGDSICQCCYEDSYFSCEDCGEVYHCDDMATGDDGCCCSDCQPDGENFSPGIWRNRSGCITETGSARCYGIELETDHCGGYEDLNGSTPWGAKYDATCSGKEFYSAILSGDEGLDAVREWAEVAKRNHWGVDTCCGYHLHLNMRGESEDSLYAIAYAYRATQEVWAGFVDKHRANSSYSHRCTWDCADVPAHANGYDFCRWAYKDDRYTWFNTDAYSKFTTFEIRSHEGTCDGDAVINWVKAHTRFADWASSKGLDGVREALYGLDDKAMAELIGHDAWQDESLCEYYANKAHTQRS